MERKMINFHLKNALQMHDNLLLKSKIKTSNSYPDWNQEPTNNHSPSNSAMPWRSPLAL